MERISRTIGSDQVVDELVLSFTRDIAMDHLLPGVPPTGKRVRPAVCGGRIPGRQAQPRGRPGTRHFL
jgi:hypothetical protein